VPILVCSQQDKALPAPWRTILRYGTDYFVVSALHVRCAGQRREVRSSTNNHGRRATSAYPRHLLSSHTNAAPTRPDEE
jgi:hypothetical protein